MTLTSIRGRARDYEIVPSDVVVDVEPWLHQQLTPVRRAISPLFQDFIIKGRCVLVALFKRVDAKTGDTIKEDNIYLSSLPADIIEDLDSWFERHVQAIITNFNNYQGLGSDLIFVSVNKLIFKLSLSKNQRGKGSFKMPAKLANMKAVINVDCKEACFKYAILSILHYNDVKNRHHSRVSSYKQWEDELNFDDINTNEIDISKDVPKIERLNNLKLNIHVYDKGLQGVRYNRRSVLAPRTVNILLVVNEQGEKHYCGITQLSRLYWHTTKNHCMQHYCDRCIRAFKSSDKLEQHYQHCSQGKLQLETMPTCKEYYYSEFGNELSPCKVVYADIECYIDNSTATHHPAAIAAYEVWHSHFSREQNKTKIQTWQGKSCIKDFLMFIDKMVRQLHKLSSHINRNPMSISEAQQADFDKCKTCPRCQKPFDDAKHKKVRDHCHISGQYRSPLCHTCNSRLRLKRRLLPIIFHNLKGYDAHMIIRGGLGEMKHWQLSVVPQTREKYMCITAQIPVDKTKEGKTVFFTIKFLDSYQFMSSSLDRLSSNLETLKLSPKIKNIYPSVTDSLIRRKGIFPYAYFDSLDRLDETSLPPISAFKNDLTGEECSVKDYEHAQVAWQEFGCKTFNDYMISYLHLDVFLLADVFEEFRSVTLKEDGLDPVHFISLPGLSYQSAFKMTGETIHLLQDAEMYSLFERGIRGGLTFVNKHLTVSDTNVHLAYIDQNNLYGSALSKPLPHSEFTWLGSDDIKYFSNPDNILKLDDEGEWGYLFEVDLDYPQSIHDTTSDFPLAPESGYVTADMFSPYMTSFREEINKAQGSTKSFKPCRKLLLTQYNKKDYIVHFCILKFYLKMGLILCDVKRVIRFKQKRWVQRYIDYNSKKRSQAKNSFEKDYYKLKNNSLFGKMMEDVRKRMQYKLVNNVEKFEKLMSSPLFLDRDIISEDVVGVHMLKNKVVLDKPIFVGQAVLDYSKLEMYNLYYNILQKCSLIKKAELVGGDTDSFFLAITTDTGIGLHDVFETLSQHLDSSNYNTNHFLYSNNNRARLGCFKDETGGREIAEMILLRPKMYSMKYKDNDDSIKRAKGISRCIVKDMKHKAYREALDATACNSHVTMTILKSSLHSVQTFTFRKRGLSSWEDKRCWLDSNYSLPHGHYNTGVPPPKRPRIQVPPTGDVETSDVE